MKSRTVGPRSPLAQVAPALPVAKPGATPLAKRLGQVASAAVGPRSLPELTRRILSLHASLAALPSLAPSPKVNALFGELVALTNAADEATANAILANPEIAAILPDLRRICAYGEAQLETHWAKRICASNDPQRELQNFPYYDNYERLARLEVHALRGVTTQPLERAVFIGSGPMPLSSLMFGGYGMTIDNLDIDGEAIALGRAVAKSAGLDANQRFLHCDVMAYPIAELAKADVVCVAALAGLDPKDKGAILEHLAEHMRPGAILMVRSADRLRRLLYPVIQPEDVHGFEPLSAVRPLNDVVNTALVCQKPL